MEEEGKDGAEQRTCKPRKKRRAVKHYSEV